MPGSTFKAIVSVALLFLSTSLIADDRPRIAIIIDDLGYERAAGERAVALPGELSFAVLPHAPYSARFAELVHDSGREVLLHLPLQATSDPSDVTTGELVLDMNEQEFREAFGSSIASVPHVVGINTHRGSLLTRHPGHMQWLMEEIVARSNLFFVDSYTTAESVALRMAREKGIPAIRRHVFLDPDQAPQTVEREFDRLIKLAQEQGVAVGIGHPYPETLAFLERALPALEDVDLVPVSALVTSATSDAH